MLGLENDGVTPYPCNSAGPFAGKSCADFTSYEYASNNTVLYDNYEAAVAQGNPQNLKSPSYPKITNPLQATNISGQDPINNAWLQAGNTGSSPCIADLTAANSFEGGAYVSSPPLPTASNPTPAGYNDLSLYPSSTAMPFYQIPTECFNPVMLAIIKKYVPPA